MNKILLCLLLVAAHVKASDVNNVMHYGAVPNDGADDTPAFVSAISNSNGVVYIPAGEYNLSSQLRFTGSVQALKGDGMGVSRLIWESGNGVYFKPPVGYKGVALLQGISLITQASDSGNAFHYNGLNNVSNQIVNPRTKAKLVIRDIELNGYSSQAASGWNRGAIIDESLGVIVSGFRFGGQVAPLDRPMSDVAIWMRGKGKPVEVTMSDVSVYHTKHAILVKDHEGLFIENANLVAVDFGVQMETDVEGTKPQLNISDSHINCRVACVVTNDINDISVKNNLFYLRSSAEKNGFGVKLTGLGKRFIISGNIFASTSSLRNFDAVYSTGSYGLISNNVFNNGNRGTSVWLGNGSDQVRGSGNLCNSCGDRFLNWGAASNRIKFDN
ncbi:hypothetical protein NBRC116188_28940 [Oceaniserpentilla sp. 4NH20-0058]|uniref:glycosyl hydrolase family 28-related protein n=1 Tax=Oceaniserpentilla sp. 4NH20-0058 TaxID=3127660 RepID=UPI00310C208E